MGYLNNTRPTGLKMSYWTQYQLNYQKLIIGRSLKTLSPFHQEIHEGNKTRLTDASLSLYVEANLILTAYISRTKTSISQNRYQSAFHAWSQVRSLSSNADMQYVLNHMYTSTPSLREKATLARQLERSPIHSKQSDEASSPLTAPLTPNSSSRTLTRWPDSYSDDTTDTESAPSVSQSDQDSVFGLSRSRNTSDDELVYESLDRAHAAKARRVLQSYHKALGHSFDQSIHGLGSARDEWRAVLSMIETAFSQSSRHKISITQSINKELGTTFNQKTTKEEIRSYLTQKRNPKHENLSVTAYAIFLSICCDKKARMEPSQQDDDSLSRQYSTDGIYSPAQLYSIGNHAPQHGPQPGHAI